jgi:hypothetical protein
MISISFQHFNYSKILIWDRLLVSSALVDGGVCGWGAGWQGDNTFVARVNIIVSHTKTIAFVPELMEADVARFSISRGCVARHPFSSK